jgi:hypothetical protein
MLLLNVPAMGFRRSSGWHAEAAAKQVLDGISGDLKEVAVAMPTAPRHPAASMARSSSVAIVQESINGGGENA